MHPRCHHAIYSPLALATLLAAGCHTALPTQRQVQVTNRPAEEFAEIAPPPQRLATGRPREREAEIQDNGSQAPDETPVQSDTDARIEQSLATLGISDRRSRPPERTGQPERTSQTKPSSNGKLATGGPASDPAPPAAAAVEAETPQARLADAMLPAVERDELIDAFSSSPPEVQELALRQLIAIAARTAQKTSQPGDIHTPLNQALAQAANNTMGSRVAIAQASASPSETDTNPVGDLPPVVVQAVDTQQVATADRPAPPPVQTVSATVASPLPDSAEKPEPPNQSPSTAQLQAADKPAPVADPAALSEQALFAALLERLSHADEDEGDAERSRREIMRRHLMVLAGDPDRAVTEIDGLSDEEQEYLRHQLLALWTIVDPGGHPVPGRRFSTALPQLREATKFLAASTDSLEIRSLAFCKEIESYGQIKEFSRNRFSPGQQVILYCEVDNFTTQRTAEGYETHLQGSYSVYNKQNEKVFSQLLPADKQLSRNYLRDYFIAYQMHLPKQLADGDYRLELTMEDVGGKKYGQASVPFEIAE